MNISGRFLRVWKVEENNGFIKADLGDSTKNKDGSYNNFTWFGVAILGKSKESGIAEGDVIEVKSGLIGKRKYNDKYYDDMKVFELEISKKGSTPTTETDTVAIDNLADLPF